MAKKNGDAVAGATAAPVADSLGQIREIILGEFMRASDAHFRKMQASFDAFKQETDARLSELEERISFVKEDGEVSKGSLQEALDTSQAEFEKQVKELGSKLKNDIKTLHEDKVDKSSIGEVFIQWGEQVKSR